MRSAGWCGTCTEVRLTPWCHRVEDSFEFRICTRKKADMRCMRILALSLLLTSHLQAQTVPAADGWRARHDEAGATAAAPEVFVTMPPGWHVTTDAAGIF